MTNQAEIDLRNRLVSLTRDLILIPSSHSRPDDQLRCFEFVKNHLDSIETVSVQEFSHQGKQSLIAAAKGCTNIEILLCGHLDVVDHPDSSVYRSHLEDGRIYGPGAGDMKGSLAMLLELFCHIHSHYQNVPLGIAITSDEEIGGEAGIGYLFKEEGIRCRMAMIPDGGMMNKITIEEKGILHLSLQSHGIGGHAARPWLGKNSIEVLMERFDQLRRYFDSFEYREDHWHPTCAITVIETDNRTHNCLPENARAVLDIRFPAPHTVDQMLRKVKEIMGDDVETKVIISAEPTHLAPDPQYKEAIEEVIDQPVEYVCDHGGSDARFISAYDIPVLMSRPWVGNLHAQDEWIDVQSLVQFYWIYENYLGMKLGLE